LRYSIDERSAVSGEHIVMGGTNDSGVTRITSQHSVTDTLARLESVLKERGVMIFARIDFSGDAARAGLTMRPEQMLIFGNPKAGTPLMQSAPAVGLDLPLKALVWQDASGQTLVAYNDPQYIIRRHGLDAAFAANLAAVVPLIERAAGP
jgi:uncharacterized protein (DUF302 family)